MRFVFDERKAAQSASVLLDRHGGAMPYIKLIKLLYLADRASLVETGAPITGDRFVAMRHGPVLSRVLDLIREPDPGADSVWHAHVAREHYDAVLVGTARADQLSEYEEAVLASVFDAHGEAREWDIVARTHALPEWTDPGASAIPIEPEDILRYAGYSDDELRAAAEQADAVHALRSTLARAG